MGMKPLAVTIGLFSVGIFLTGCGCCGQKKQAFMNGGADRSLGVTNRMNPPSWKDNPQSSVAQNGTVDASAVGGSSTAVPNGKWSNSAGNTSLSGGNMAAPGGVPSPMPNGTMPSLNSAGSPLPGTSMNIPGGSGDSPLGGAASRPSLATAGASNYGTPSAGLMQASARLDSSTGVKTADYQLGNSVAGAVPPMSASSGNGAGTVPLPPLPPSISGASSGGTTATSAASPWSQNAAPPAPPPPPSTSMTSALPDPPPSASMGTSPSTIPTGGKSLSAPGALPSYLQGSMPK